MSLPLRASLVRLPAVDPSKSILLEKRQTTIGRAPTNTIQMTHAGVSRVHATIAFENNQYVVNDLGSRNGTYVNNKKVDRAVLQNGDKIIIGKRVFVFLVEGIEDQNSALEFSPAFEETVSISTEELEQSKLLMHNAHTAAQNFFERPATDLEQAEYAELVHARISGLYHLSENLRTAVDPDEILEEGLAFLFNALPSAQRAVAMLRSGGTGTLEARTVKYRNPDPDQTGIPVSSSILDRVLREQVAIVNRNLQDDPHFCQADSIVSHDIKSIICVPLMNRDAVIGALHLDNSDCLNPFTRDDMEFTAAVANELALSIANVNLQKKVINNEKMAAIGLTITNLAHNIRNLYNVQLNSVVLLDAEIQTIKHDRIASCWSLVRESLEKIAGLTSEMLEYTEVDSIKARPIDINAVIRAECEMLQKNLTTEGIGLELNLRPDLSEWMVDKKHLQRAILNLVVNAKDALKGVDEACIKITTELEDDRQLIIRVSDNGCGIPKDARAKIFELFYTTKGTNGTGIGLAMIQKFVENQGGRFTVVSQLDVGSVFSMSFPRTDEQPSG